MHTLFLIAHAATDGLDTDLLVPIGGLGGTGNLPSLPEYIQALYTWGVGAAALLAVLMLVVGGFQYVLSAGNFGSTEAAKNRMTSAVYGVVILLGASLILSLVNKDLTDISLASPRELPAQVALADAGLEQGKIMGFLGSKAGQVDVSDKLNTLNEGYMNTIITKEQYEGAAQKVIVAFDARYADPAVRKGISDKMEAAWAKVGDTPTPAQIETRIATQRLEEYRAVLSKLKNVPQNMRTRETEYVQAISSATTH